MDCLVRDDASAVAALGDVDNRGHNGTDIPCKDVTTRMGEKADLLVKGVCFMWLCRNENFEAKHHGRFRAVYSINF